MRCACTLLLVATVFAAEGTGPTTLRLKKEDVGKLPPHWTAAKTGKGEGSVWKVMADASAPSRSGLVLAQTAAGPARLFNLCVADGSSHGDVEITVSFKSVKGKIDQGGGVMWRYRDANNYYIARYNPLEENYRVYKVIDGDRVQLKTKEKLTVADGKWHTLKVRHVGDRIECHLNGTKYLEAKDATFPKPGQVGLWTKADAQTLFDGFTARTVPRSSDQ